MFSPWVTHRDPRFFPEPEKFVPDRWTPEFRRSIPRYAYFPFGAGPRACVGNHFAMMELVLIVATFLQRARLEQLSTKDIAHSLSVTLRPSDQIHASLRKHTLGNAPTVRPPASRRPANDRVSVRPSALAARRSSPPPPHRGPPGKPRSVRPGSSAVDAADTVVQNFPSSE